MPMINKDLSSGLELTNDGRLSLLFLGTGSAFSKKYYQTNLLVVKGQDHILVDCGTLCPFVLEQKYNTQLSQISNLILTHPHADHIGGVEEIALCGKYIKQSKINLVITDEFKEVLWKNSICGGLQLCENGELTFEDYFNQITPVPLSGAPFEMYETNVGSINIKLFRTRHVTFVKDSDEISQISYGMIFDDKVLFTSDTQFNKPQLDYLLENFPIKVIFHDCDIAGFSEGVHASYNQLKTLPENVRKMMYLCHYNSAAEKINPEADGFKKLAKSGVWYRC